MTLTRETKAKRFSKFNKVLIFLLAFLASYTILMTSIVTKRYSLSEGDISKADIKATREIVDKRATELKILQAKNSVSEQYEKKLEVKNTVVEDIRALFTKVVLVKQSNISDKEKLNTLISESPMELDNDDFEKLLELSDSELSSMQEYLITLMGEIYDTMTINDGDSYDLFKAQDVVAAKVNESQYAKSIKQILISIGKNQVKPNFFYDETKTEALRNSAANAVQSVVIKKNQIIVKEGEPVTADQIEILSQLNLLGQNFASQWYIYISLAVLVLAIISLQGYYLFKYYKDIYVDNSKLMLITILSCIALLLARTLGLISPFLIPFACVPMIMTLLINYRVSLIINIMNAVLISVVVNFNTELIIISFVSAVLGSMTLRKMQARNDMFLASLFICITNIIITFSTGVLLSDNVIVVVQNALLVGLSSIIAAIIAIGILPIFETAFDVVTTIKLLELLNPNHPLLKKLLVEAPGTYHHSIMVANLAEIATETIGGDSILARVGAYYHDVGKIKRPYFFIENQFGTENPHVKIKPKLSAFIITSHVKDGVEIAKNYKMPQIVLDIIKQHHGDSLVKYFYISMKNASTSLMNINEEEFRYPGPNPISKEAAVIMLADSVEASVRSIQEPTVEKIEEMVNNIFKDKLNDGQLNCCELTLGDIERIREAFLKSLTGIYHQRIEYPVDKTE